MGELFKNKNKKKGVGVTDLISKIVQVLKRDLYWVRISTQKVGLIKPVKPWNKGQLSHIVKLKTQEYRNAGV